MLRCGKRPSLARAWHIEAGVGGWSAFLHHSGLWPGIGQQPHKYRVGQNVHLAFSIRCSRKTPKNFFANSIFATVVKNLPAHEGNVGLIPGLEKVPHAGPQHSVTNLCLTLCNPVDCSKAGFSVLHYLPEFAQTHVH